VHTKTTYILSANTCFPLPKGKVLCILYPIWYKKAHLKQVLKRRFEVQQCKIFDKLLHYGSRCFIKCWSRFKEAVELTQADAANAKLLFCPPSSSFFVWCKGMAQDLFRVKCPPIGQAKVEALKYTLAEGGDAVKEVRVVLNVSVDRKYVNIELENGVIVYSLKTSELAHLLSSGED